MSKTQPAFSEVLTYSVDNRVATIRLNRPESLNSLNAELRKDLLIAVNRANSDDDVRVVVISGAGRGFCAGADLNESYQDSYNTIEAMILAESKPIMLAIHNSSKIYISSVSGVAAGMGGSLAMVCDLSIMSEDAYLYQAFAAIALIPDLGTCWHLTKQVGYKRAVEMTVGAEKTLAKTCVELGIANRIVASGELAGATRAWAEQLAKGAPLAQRYTKEVLKKALTMPLAEVIDLEANRQNITIVSRDHQEGVNALSEKRTPIFKGE